MGCSHGVSRISLLDGDNRHPPGVIHAYDIRDSQSFELIPDKNAARGEDSATRAEKRWRSKNDRIIAIKYAFDNRYGSRPRAASVVAGHFPEGSFYFHSLLGRDHLPFQYDFGRRRDGKIGGDTCSDFHRSVAHP